MSPLKGRPTKISSFDARAMSYWLIRESRYCFMMGQVKMPDMGG